MTNGNGNLQDVIQLFKKLERSGTMSIRAQIILIHIM
jgi:hypothetical protein